MPREPNPAPEHSVIILGLQAILYLIFGGNIHMKSFYSDIWDITSYIAGIFI